MKNNIYSFFKNYKREICFFLILLIINAFLIINLNFNKFGRINIVHLIISFATSFSLVFALLLILKNKLKKLSIEKIYLLLIIPLGLSYMILFPINTIPDEANHFFRAYEISKGHLTSTAKMNNVGRKYHSNLNIIRNSNSNYNYLFSHFHKKESGKKVFFEFGNTALYSFLCYIPQAIGIFVARILGGSILLQAYFGRIFNFLCFVVVSYYSLKYIPIKKSSLFFLLFIPIVMQESVSLSPDSLTIAISLALISFVLYMRSQKNELITKKQLVVMSIISIVLSMCKIVYLPLCLLLLLIPKEKFKNSKRKYLTIILLLLFVTVINIGWLSIASNYLNSSSTTSNLQKDFIFNHPFKYIDIMFLTFNDYILKFIYEIFGCSLGNFSINVTNLYIYPATIVFIIISIFDKPLDKNTVFNFKEKLIAIFIPIVVIILIFTSLFIQWNVPGVNIIEGIQGRYFIPILMLFPLMFYTYKINPKINFTNIYLIMFILFENMYILNAIYYNFI